MDTIVLIPGASKGKLAGTHLALWVKRRGRDSSLRILLIDDNGAVLEALALLLLHEGHTVATAPDGRRGLARLEAGESVDLVLADFDMPGISGLEVVRQVRSRWPHIRVGIMTGMTGELLTQHELVDVLFRKPVNFYELREAIKRLDRPRP